MRILVADDDETLRRTVATTLRRWGHEVVSVGSGSEALEELLAPDPPRVAVLDWLMPGCSGLDVCRSLRQATGRPYTYVILLSGRGERNDRIEGLDAGADEYLVKPFDPRELEARLRTAERVLALEQLSGAPTRTTHPDGAALVAWMPDRAEVGGVIEAALEGLVCVLPFDGPLPEQGVALVELRAPDLPYPVRLLGERAGVASGGRQPAILRPTDEVSAAKLRAFLDGEARRASVPGPGGAHGVADTVQLTEQDRESLGGSVDALGPRAHDTTRGAPDPLLGRLLGGGKYQLTEVIGAGSSGVVYRAHHGALERTVAIKVLHPLYQVHPSFVGRFEREARATSMLDHECITRVLDFGREPEGLLYLVMEHLEGVTLDRLVAREGKLPTDRALDIVAQVLGALAVAHEQGVVHRDVKPENVMVVLDRDDRGEPRERVKVCDFGIAKLMGSPERRGRSEPKLTDAGVLCGTPQYMSPEQAAGREVDARADLYACGVILYELVTGEVPFVADSPVALLSKHVFEPPPPPTQKNPSLSPHVEAVILRALAKDPAHRQPSARAFREQLVALAGIGKPFAYAPSGPGRRR